jgi:hypothetical protein
MEEPWTSAVVAGVTRVAAAVRQRGREVLALAAVAVLACGVVVVVGDGGGGGGVRVVETGYSVLTDPDHAVSYGVVVENTTDDVAYHTVACVKPQLDADEYEDDGYGCRRFTVEVLLPGQSVGFGGSERLLPSDGEVTGLSVELQGPGTWEEPDEYDRGQIVARGLAVAHSPENHPVVSFDGRSSYQQDTVRTAAAYAVLRDRDGDIVGATGRELEVPVRPGEAGRHSLVHEAVVPDLATVEVYLFPSGI